MNAGQRGFTLVELVIVIAILGVLIGVAMPSYQQHMAKTQMGEAVLLDEGLKAAVASAYAHDGNCPVNGNNGVPDEVTGNYVASVTTSGSGTVLGGCTISAKLKDSGLVPAIQGKTVVVKLINEGGVLGWECSSDAEQKYLPKHCLGV